MLVSWQIPAALDRYSIEFIGDAARPAGSIDFQLKTFWGTRLLPRLTKSPGPC